MGEFNNRLKDLKIVTPGRLLFYGWLLFLMLWCLGGWLYYTSTHLFVNSTECSDWEIRAQIKSIERRLSMGEDELMSVVIPEGTLFCNTLYGFSLISCASKLKVDDPRRQSVLPQLEHLIDRVGVLKDRYPFSLNKSLSPSGGIIIAGHLNLLRAGYLLLGGTREEIKVEFDKGSKEVFEAFLLTDSAFPECYKGYTWAQDSVFALESLRLHSQITGSDYSSVIDKYRNSLKKHIDKTTGLVVAQVDPKTQKSIEGARGCATGWGLAILPALAPEFAASQYKIFASQWFVELLGCAAIHEWYQGKATSTNFHAGPVVFGMGAAASGIGIASARACGDTVSWHKLLRSLEFLGFPFVNPVMEKSYFLNLCLMADVVALWGKTIRQWDLPYSGESIEDTQSQFDSFLFLFLVALVASLSLFGLILYRLWKYWSSNELVRVGFSRQTLPGLCLQSICIILFFFCGVFSFLQLVIFMSMIDLVESLAIRPGIISSMYHNMEDN